MTNQNHCPYPRKQTALLIPGNPDGNGMSILPLPIDASLLVNSCRDDSDTTDPASVVKAINFLREYGLRVIVSRSGSHSDEPQHQRAPPRFLKLETVSEQTGMGKSTILAWEATGRFPRAVRLSATIRVWLSDDVFQWIREKHEKAIAPTNRPDVEIGKHDAYQSGGTK